MQLVPQIVAAIKSAALAAGATAEPTVTVREAASDGSVGRRRLASTGLLVTATFAPGDQGPARQLGTTLASSPEAVLPPEQFGGLQVTAVQLNGAPPTAQPPSKGTSIAAIVGGAVGGAAAALAGETYILDWARCVFLLAS